MESVKVIDYIKLSYGINEIIIKKWDSEKLFWKEYKINDRTPKYILYAPIGIVKYKTFNNYIKVIIWLKI